MLVDYERAYLELRTRLIEKNSWGQRELLVLLTQVEVDNRLPEGAVPIVVANGNGSKQPATERPRAVVGDG